MRAEIKGVLPAIVTPLDEGGDIDGAALENLLERLYAAGVNGVYVGGSTGEGRLLSSKLRQKLAELSAQLSPKGKHVVVHIGATTAEETMELAEHASMLSIAGLSVAGISSLPLPSASRESLPAFYATIAARSKVPLLAYYFPSLTGEELTYDELMTLGDIPNLFGIKYTDYDLYKVSRLSERGVAIFNGRDEVLAAGLLMGAVGGIGSIYNVAPRLFVQLYERAMAREWEEARHLQIQVNRIIEILLKFPFIPAVKEVLGWTGVACGRSLSDVPFLTNEQSAELRRLMEPLRSQWEQ